LSVIGTPLAAAVHKCCAAEHANRAQRGQQMAEFLLKRGPATNLPDDEPSATPLAWARKLELADVEQVLLKHGETA
jgi:ankyrin repeat protein